MSRCFPMKSSDRSLKEKAEAELERRRRFALQKSKPITLAEFTRVTTGHELDQWQTHLCERLERLAHETDQRIVIHAPPQFGKTIVLSQRFPVWLLAQKPAITIKLACYNITRAAKHSRVARDIMESPQYVEMFPSPELRLPSVTSGNDWSTAARISKHDGQSSFKALGLITGFVGEGADLLLIDDPYASPEDARSELINDKICSFWPETAKPRLKPGGNVVMMFHRYTEDDKAGRVLAEGGWEYIRYAAVADGDYVLPATGQSWPDPLGREEGEYLSSRFPPEWYADRENDGYTWLSQFQGRPSAKEGEFFKINKIETVDVEPSGLRKCRAWDLAASKGTGAYTSGVLIGTDDKGIYYVCDVERGQLSADDVKTTLKSTAIADGTSVAIHLPQDPGQAGKAQAEQLIRFLSGFIVMAEPVTGSKETRAFSFAAQVNSGNVKVIKGAWTKAFKEELRQFPRGKYKDQVDSASDSFNELALGGQSFSGTFRR
jgi:predicted phage terminase large subunit-like protein